jgi:micrococcal nuclease
VSTIAPARTTDAAIEPAPPAEPDAAARPTASEAPDWLPPVDGGCPPGYPIKANDNSHIYHMPGGRFYGRPIAERCYATEAAAQRDGYRRAKS